MASTYTFYQNPEFIIFMVNLPILIPTVLEIDMNLIPHSELILNSDGSVYHLKLLPEDIADKVFRYLPEGK